MGIFASMRVFSEHLIFKISIKIIFCAPLSSFCRLLCVEIVLGATVYLLNRYIILAQSGVDFSSAISVFIVLLLKIPII